MSSLSRPEQHFPKELSTKTPCKRSRPCNPLNTMLCTLVIGRQIFLVRLRMLPYLWDSAPFVASFYQHPSLCLGSHRRLLSSSLLPPRVLTLDLGEIDCAVFPQASP